MKIKSILTISLFALTCTMSAQVKVNGTTLSGGTNSPNGYLGSDSQHDLIFKTFGQEKMRLLSGTGNLGLGTTSPTQMLHLNNGCILLQGTTPGIGGPNILFGGSSISATYGEYGIEYNANSGLNFWKPSGSHNLTNGVPPISNYVLLLNDDGNIGMGVDAAKINVPNYAYRLSVNGGIRATKVVVETGWADYVFKKDYKLMPLNEVNNFIKTNGHLPNIPSALEIEEKGLDLGSLQTKQMEKIEELTLYIIELNKAIDALKLEVETLKKK